ncbi:MAG: hypothetical protein BWZ10_01493 [candidate division BRC1 bacterium ADurb.BinA364]|nr:MAG: hypothetical protein BWZ10_01493 [candidate division BRC1 bacterium ADurb.BinA364]
MDHQIGAVARGQTLAGAQFLLGFARLPNARIENGPEAAQIRLDRPPGPFAFAGRLELQPSRQIVAANIRANLQPSAAFGSRADPCAACRKAPLAPRLRRRQVQCLQRQTRLDGPFAFPKGHGAFDFGPFDEPMRKRTALVFGNRIHLLVGLSAGRNRDRAPEFVQSDSVGLKAEADKIVMEQIIDRRRARAAFDPFRRVLVAAEGENQARIVIGGIHLGLRFGNPAHSRTNEKRNGGRQTPDVFLQPTIDRMRLGQWLAKRHRQNSHAGSRDPCSMMPLSHIAES